MTPVQLNEPFQLVSVPVGEPSTTAPLKLAVTFLLAFIVTETGLVVPLADPLQFEKVYEPVGAAVN